jgi:hypothetical protein
MKHGWGGIEPSEPCFSRVHPWLFRAGAILFNAARAERTMPTVKDFTCTLKPEDDWDGFYAWKNFGGLTVDEAYQKFCQVPENYQEDFMFMGDAAFAFYFPVIDRYVREKEPKIEMEGVEYPFDGETHILASCIGNHIGTKCPAVRALYAQIVSLCHFVLHAVNDVASDERRTWSLVEIKAAWGELLQTTLSALPDARK